VAVLRNGRSAELADERNSDTWNQAHENIQRHRLHGLPHLFMKMFADWLDRAAQDSVVILIFETRVMCLSAALKNRIMIGGCAGHRLGS